MASEIRTGGCLCGSVRFSASGAATNRCVCHCMSCRRASGAPFVAWATFSRPGFRITLGKLTIARSSEKVMRGFCAACGTSLSYAHDDRAEEIDVALATLDDTAAIAPEYHVWVSEKLPWVTPGDGLPQFLGWKKDG